MNRINKIFNIIFFTFVMSLFSSCNDEKIKFIYFNTSPVSIEMKIPQFGNEAVNNFYDDGLNECWTTTKSYFNSDSLSKEVFQIEYPMGRDCNNYVYCNPKKVVKYLDTELININKYAINLKHYRKKDKEFTVYATRFNNGFFGIILFDDYWIMLYLKGVSDEDKQLDILNSIKKSNFNNEY